MLGKGLDGGVTVQQDRGDRSAQPIGQFPGQTHDGHGVESILNKWLSDIHLRHGDVEAHGETVQQPVLDGFGCHPPRDDRCVCGHLGCVFFRLAFQCLTE